MSTKHLLIISATEKEIAHLLQAYPFTLSNEKHRVYSAFQNDCHISILVTGVGMTAMAFHLASMLAVKRYDLAINAGIAGSFREEIQIGEVVDVREDCFADLGAEDGNVFLDLTEMGLMQADEFPFRGRRLINDTAPNVPAISLLKKVCGITVNKVLGKKETIDWARQRYAPDTVSMEGAAFFYACLHYGLPCLQLRAISNYVEPRNKEHWNIPLAIEQLNEQLRVMLQTMVHR